MLDSCETSDILLWAIFANRKEIAEICWIRGEDHLGKLGLKQIGNYHKKYFKGRFSFIV